MSSIRPRRRGPGAVRPGSGLEDRLTSTGGPPVHAAMLARVAATARDTTGHAYALQKIDERSDLDTPPRLGRHVHPASLKPTRPKRPHAAVLGTNAAGIGLTQIGSVATTGSVPDG